MDIWNDSTSMKGVYRFYWMDSGLIWKVVVILIDAIPALHIKRAQVSSKITTKHLPPPQILNIKSKQLERFYTQWTHKKNEKVLWI